MSLIKGLFDRQKSEGEPFAPTATVPRSTTQEAVQYVMDNAGGGGGGSGAPTDAEYLVRTADATLTNERAVTDTSTIVWDWSTANQAKASLQHLGIESLSDPGADRGIFWDDSSGALSWMLAGTGLGFIGTYLSITDADLVAIADASFSAGDVLYHDGTTLTRLAAGTDGQFLRTRGSGGTPPDWQNISGGGDMLRANNLSDLTSAATGRTNLGVAIGSDVQAWDADLDAVAALASTGFASRTAANAWAQRTLQAPAAGLSISNPAGVAGDPTFSLANDLAALEGLGSTGFAARTAADTWAQRSLTEPAAGLTIANPSGVAGNPTFALANDLAALEGLALTGFAVRSASDTWVQRSVAVSGAGLSISNGDGVAANPTISAADDLAALEALSGTDTLYYRSGVSTWSAVTIGGLLSFSGGTLNVGDAELAAIAGLTSSADSAPYFTGSGTAALMTVTSFARSILDDANEATFKATVNLEIGTDVQAYDATLASISALGTAADKIAYTTGIDTWAETALTSFGRSLIDDADASASRTTLGLVIGTNVQAYDATLTSIASLGTAADKLAYTTGIDTWAETGLTAFGRSIIDDADEATFKATVNLEIGTDVQAYNARLADLAGLTYAQGDVIYYNGTNLVNLGPGTSGQFLKTLGAGANPAWATISAGGTVTSVGIAISGSGLSVGGSPVTTSGDITLTVDAELSALAGLTSAADKVPYYTGSGTAALADFTSFARTLTDDANAAAALATLTALGQGKTTIWIPASAMTARTTNGAASGTAEMTTNKNMFKTLDFDATTQEFSQFEIHMPKSWDLGTVTFQPVWSHASTTTNFGVVWALAAIARSDDDAGDVAFGTAQNSADTGGTTNDIYIGPESSAITVGGTPAAGDTVQFQIARVPANGSDTMAIDARLHGIRVFFTTNAATDA